MKPPRVTGDPTAVLGDAVNRLVREFDYPDMDTLPPAFRGGGGGGMAHILIVSDSEPAEIQAKADYVVTQTGAAAQLNEIFASLGNNPWSIWMAGTFNLEEDVVAPSGAWIRGLGYTSAGYTA